MEQTSRSRRGSFVTGRARGLRAGGNQAEGRLWLELKDRGLGGYKFVRQFPIGPYFADFLCRKLMLVVELDGNQHAGNARDALRDKYMNDLGYSVLRIWSHDVLGRPAEVFETILAVLDGCLAKKVAAADLRYYPSIQKIEPK